jgi:L-lactate dehydrogenase complex protein LldG
MSDAARDAILGAVKRSLKAESRSAEAKAAVEARLAAPPSGLVPERSAGSPADRLALFEAMAREFSATTERVASSAEVPEAVGAYLKGSNLPPKVKLAPDPDLQGLDWTRGGLLDVASGPAVASDEVSVTPAFAAIAETGTLMLLSGPAGPTTLNFLPDNHIVVLRASQVVGAYEAAWARLRETYGPGKLPRTVNLITGPSRTADIEQTIQLGAHGPRRLHILVVEDG